MSILQDVLEEENQRLLRAKAHYERLLQDLPKGSLSIKKRTYGEYAYLAYRDADKHVVFKYIGKAGSEAVQFVEEQIKKRKQLQEQKKEVEFQIVQVTRSLNAIK